MPSNEPRQDGALAAHARLEAAIKQRYPAEADRPWVFLHRRYPEISVQTAQNWKTRGIPQNVTTRKRLAEFLGLQSLEELDFLLSGGSATGLPLDQAMKPHLKCGLYLHSRRTN